MTGELFSKIFQDESSSNHQTCEVLVTQPFERCWRSNIDTKGSNPKCLIGLRSSLSAGLIVVIRNARRIWRLLIEKIRILVESLSKSNIPHTQVTHETQTSSSSFGQKFLSHITPSDLAFNSADPSPSIIILPVEVLVLVSWKEQKTLKCFPPRQSVIPQIKVKRQTFIQKSHAEIFQQA